MPTLPSIPPHIVRHLIGNLWNWSLFGVLVVQTPTVLCNPGQVVHPTRRFALEVVQTVLSGADVFYWVGSGYGDVTRLASLFASAFQVSTSQLSNLWCPRWFNVSVLIVSGRSVISSPGGFVCSSTWWVDHKRS
ncbi:hypothetical protein F5888DRAFT_1803075 [Russula emetica]|nr:hypothetical protein F5888DRAFT_1803075 [Russula emetica]